MKTLAELCLDYLILLELGDESIIDTRYCVKTLAPLFADLREEATGAEKHALSTAARERLAWLLREPDEHGYTPRKLVTQEMRDFLTAIGDGSALEPEE